MGHTLQFANRHIVTLINAFWGKQLVQRVHNSGFPHIHTISQGLQNKVIVKLIDDECGHAVGFAKNEPAVFGVANLLSVLPGIAYAVKKELFVNGFVQLSGKQAHCDLAFGVAVSTAYKFFCAVVNLHNFAGRKCFKRRRFQHINLVYKNPGVPIFYPWAYFFAQE